MWVGRGLADAEYGPGVCFDVDPDAAGAAAADLGWEVGDLADALACDLVCTVTPGAVAVVDADSLRPGQHLNLLGADGPGKAEASVDAIARVHAEGRVFCDEWEQASHGGELTGAVAAGVIGREDVTELGAVCAGLAAGRESAAEITLFDSTGLAIQDLAIALGALEALRAGAVKAQTVSL
jgi:ornithine cyclodeaminase/alanine dehydrogenase-like protein (mu-crystallin family)